MYLQEDFEGLFNFFAIISNKLSNKHIINYNAVKITYLRVTRSIALPVNTTLRARLKCYI